MTAEIVSGNKIATDLRKSVSNQVNLLRTKYKTKPNITTIKIGEDPQSDLYLNLREKACEEVGINSSHLKFVSRVSEDEVVKSIKKLNSDENVHGIFIQFPVPEHISQDNLIKALNPKKDVEGLTPFNMGRTLLGDEYIIPITPLSILTILKHEKAQLQGKDIVIINHSNLVGKPLSSLLLNRNATVSICHVFTKDLKDYSSKADILITAAGVPRLIKADHVKDNAFVIDVGIIKTKDGVCGDVDFESVKEKAGKITPVPGGVGPVTVACSLVNMIKTFKNCFEEK